MKSLSELFSKQPHTSEFYKVMHQYVNHYTGIEIPDEDFVSMIAGTVVVGAILMVFILKSFANFIWVDKTRVPKKRISEQELKQAQRTGSNSKTVQQLQKEVDNHANTKNKRGSEEKHLFDIDANTGQDMQREGLVSRLIQPEPSVADGPNEGGSAASSGHQHDAVTKEVVDLLAGISLEGGATQETLQRISELSSQLNEQQLAAIKSQAKVDDQDLHTYMLLHTMRCTKATAELFSASLPGMNQSVMSAEEKQRAEEVAATMKKAFWDMFKQELEKENFTIIVERLEELVAKMVSFVQKRPTLVTDKVDVPFIKQQIEKKVFDRNSLIGVCQLIVGVLELMESEFQHENTVKWLAEYVTKVGDETNKFSDLAAEAFTYFFDRLDQLEADIKNYKASLAVPAQRAKWEQEHFEMMLEKKSFTLNRATDLLRKYREAEREHPAMTIRRAVCTLVSGDAPVQWIDLPEMMYYDPPALHLLQNRFQSCLLTAIFALNFSAHLPQSEKEKVSEFFTSVQEFMLTSQVNKETLLKHVETQYTIALGGKIDESQFKDVDKMMEQVIKCVTPDEKTGAMPPLYQLFKKKLVAALNLGARPNPQGGANKIPENALGDKPWTLSFACEKAQGISDDLSNFVMEHIKVYGNQYMKALAPLSPGLAAASNPSK